MRYLFGFLCVCALVWTSPENANAQDAEEAATPEPSLQEPAPSSKPAPEEPALQLKLDDTGVGVVPSPPRTTDGYTLEEMELRVKRARIGRLSSAGAFVVGTGMAFGAFGAAWSCSLAWSPSCYSPPGWVAPVGWTGMVLMVGGISGMIASGILVRRRKRDRDRLQQSHHEAPRWVQWDLAQSRLVF
jgi:hypothetical protein